MIPDGPRRTACVSSQVGCPVGCRFCASGLNGVKGNLSAAQIVEQVFQLQRRLPSVAGHPDRIDNIVFMGMGEPLANYANVMQAIRVLHDPDGLNISARKITISTVGVPAKMRELAAEELPLNLAISLHAPNEKLRRQLIPWAEHFTMHEILEAARFYFDRTGREITLEYILLANVNDRPEHARQLVGICRTLRANVNLIRYNEVESLPYQRPGNDAVMAFQGYRRRLRTVAAKAGAGCCSGARVSRRRTQAMSRRSNSAFTIVELLVAVFVLGVLGTILVPYVMKLREADRRTMCERNLGTIWDALQHYAKDNHFDYPRVVYDAAHEPNSYNCFTGPDSHNPFSPGNAVRSNDVTASLWLLIRTGLLQDPRVFVCPSSSDRADSLTDAAGRSVPATSRSNFRSGNNLSYGYASPFSSAPQYVMNDTHLGDFVLLGDKGPPIERTGADAMSLISGPASNSPPLAFTRLNSRNHDGAGENVLYADGSVRFVRTPYCGGGRSATTAGDDSYTALAPKPLKGEEPPADGIGYWSPSIGPAWESDSYLVPIEGETPRR